MKWFCPLLFVCLFTADSHAQGLLWKLPETDGTWIRYEGDYTQIVNRPDSPEGNLSLSWRRWVTIKSVGQEQAEFEGKMQPCRWVEIKVETGKTAEGVLDAGPGGNRIYKLLIPESAIRGTVMKPIANEREVLASYLPIVKGYRKLGDEPAVEIPSGIFNLYPVVSLVRHYRNLESAGQQQNFGVAGQNITATQWQGSLVSETPVYRSKSSAELFRSDEMPFGIAKWTATVVTEQKGSTDPRSEYKETATIREELQAVAVGDNAESELLVN